MQVKLLQLSLETIGKLEPRIPALIENLLRQIASDLANRPTEKKPRKLTMELSFVPVAETEGGIVSCDTARVTFKAKPTLPQYATIDFPVNVNKAGIRFNAECPDSLDQTTLFGGPNGEDE